MKSKFLKDKTFIITRPGGQIDSFRKQLEEVGASVISFPTIAIVRNSDANLRSWVQNACSNVHQYQWLIFTSVNGVGIFFQILREIGVSPNLWSKVKTACIGEQTADMLRTHGFNPLVPKEFIAESLTELILEQTENEELKGSHVLLPRASKARNVLPESLRKAGAIVDVIPLYETKTSDCAIDPVLQELKGQTITGVIFTSSSTVSHWFEKFKGYDMDDLMKGIHTICIGPITANTLSEHGIKPTCISSTHSTAGIMESMLDFYS